MAETQRRPRRRRPGGDDADDQNDTNDQNDGQDDEQDGQSEEKDQQPHEKSMQVKKDEGLRTDTTATLAPLADANPEQWLGTNNDPDVMLSVPNIGIDHIGIEVDNLRAHVELHAKVLDLLELHVGAQVSIEKVEINIENVRVQAMLKVRLAEVYKIVDRVMTTIDNNPEILTNLTKGIGQGVQGALEGGTSGGKSGGDDDGKGESLNQDDVIEGSSSVSSDERDGDSDEEDGEKDTD